MRNHNHAAHRLGILTILALMLTLLVSAQDTPKMSELDALKFEAQAKGLALLEKDYSNKDLQIKMLKGEMTQIDQEFGRQKTELDKLVDDMFKKAKLKKEEWDIDVAKKTFVKKQSPASAPAAPPAAK